MTNTPAAPPRRRRRWLLIPALLIAGLVGAVVWFYVRGTRVEETARDPDQVGRSIAQVVRDDQGRPCVRAAILLAHNHEAVWGVVTDYANYDDILPYLRDIKVKSQADGCRMTGEARSALPGYWKFDIDIRETKAKDRWQARWEKVDDGEVLLNRGGWTVVPKGDRQTLLVLTLEADVKGTPTFLLRNTFLHRLPLVLAAVERRLTEKKEPPE